MTTTATRPTVTTQQHARGPLRLLAVLVMIGGVVLALGGAATWGLVQTSLTLLFTSVVSFGIAAMAMGMGVLFVLIGYSLRRLAATTSPA